MATILNTQSIITVPQIESIATDGSSTIYVNEDKQQLRQIPVNQFLASIKQNICNTIYPVGSIYISMSPSNPNALFGGTWTALEGRFLLGANSTYTVGATGGSADAVVVSHSHAGGLHTHTINSHTHSVSAHTHTIGNHYHSLNNHTHSISLTSGGQSQSHTHSFSWSGSHKHSFANGGGNALTVGGSEITWSDSNNKGIARESSGKGWWYKEKKAHGAITNTTINVSGTTGSTSQGHTHSVSGSTGAANGSTGSAGAGTTSGTALATNGSGTLTTNKGGNASTGTTGESGTGKNLPPYVAVYMWKRTA